MFAVDVCLLPATGGTTGIAVAALVLLVLGVVVARWVRASAGRLSVVATVPILLMALVGASAPSVECAQELLVPPTTSVAPTTTGVPTTTVVPVAQDLVLQINIPVSNPTAYVFGLGLAGTVNVTIDWGDNTTSVVTTAQSKGHTYSTPGQYEIRVSGTLTELTEADMGMHPEYLVGASSFGDLGLTSLYKAFYGADNLVSVPSVLPSTVVNLESVFWSADSFNHPNIGAWDTSNVTNMNFLFDDASAFNQSLSGWDTGSVSNMAGMFSGASAFNQSLSGWNTGSVTNMRGMFRRASAFNQSLSGWNTSNVTNMSQMFLNASMFNHASVGGWDTGNVTNMESMFRDAWAFNQSLSGWNTGNVTNMSQMFEDASMFNQSLSSWNVSLVTNMTNMLNNSAMSSANYAATLIGWASQSVQSGVAFGAVGKSVGSYGSEGCSARSILIGSTKNWIITDASDCNP